MLLVNDIIYDIKYIYTHIHLMIEIINEHINQINSEIRRGEHGRVIIRVGPKHIQSRENGTNDAMDEMETESRFYLFRSWWKMQERFPEKESHCENKTNII